MRGIWAIPCGAKISREGHPTNGQDLPQTLAQSRLSAVLRPRRRGYREMERCFTAEQQAAGRAPRASSKHSGRPAGMRVHYHVKVGEDQQKQRLSRSPAIVCALWKSPTYQRPGVSLGSPFGQTLSRLGARRCSSTNGRKTDSDPPLIRAGSLAKEQSTWNEPSEAVAGRRQSVHRSPCGSLPCSLPRLPRWPRNRLSSYVRP